MKNLTKATILSLGLALTVNTSTENKSENSVKDLNQLEHLNNLSVSEQTMKFVLSDGTVNNELFEKTYGFKLSNRDELKKHLNLTEEEYNLINDEIIMKAGFFPDLEYFQFPYNLIWLIIFCMLLGSKITRPFTVSTLKGLKEVIQTTFQFIKDKTESWSTKKKVLTLVGMGAIGAGSYYGYDYMYPESTTNADNKVVEEQVIDTKQSIGNKLNEARLKEKIDTIEYSEIELNDENDN